MPADHAPIWMREACEIAADVASGALDPVEVVKVHLDRIEALNPLVAAVCTLDAAGALASAKAIGQRVRDGQPVGPLAGVPVLVKDLIATKGLRTTFGSRLYSNHVPEVDDVVVERMRAADAVILGKTNTSEFGYGGIGHNRLFPTTRNPWDLTRTSGGSSAGSAAAVAAGLAPLALGSDGGGSVRIPAAFCGLVGFKGSMGRVPLWPGCRDETQPGASGWESLEHIGPIARTVADAALMFSVLAGPDRRDRWSLPAEIISWPRQGLENLEGLRVAFSPDLGFAQVEPAMAQTLERVARQMSDLGAKVERAVPLIGDMAATFSALVALETDLSGLRRLVAGRRDEVSPQVLAVLDTPWTAEDFTDAITERKRIANIMATFMDRYDLLLTPSVAVLPFAIDLLGPSEINGVATAPNAWTPFSALANLTGQPAISVPAGFAGGLPVGIQLIGRRLEDATLLEVAALLAANGSPKQSRWPSIAWAHGEPVLHVDPVP